MSRIMARDAIFKLTFELCFHKPEEGVLFEEFLKDNPLDSANVEFVKNTYTGIIEHFDEILNIISNNIKGYTLERLFKVDLAILIVATFELKFDKQKTPINIVANEAVELAKKYSTEKSYAFINAVIANIEK